VSNETVNEICRYILYVRESEPAYIQHPTRVKINTVINLACDRAKRMINDPRCPAGDRSQ